MINQGVFLLARDIGIPLQSDTSVRALLTFVEAFHATARLQRVLLRYAQSGRAVRRIFTLVKIEDRKSFKVYLVRVG